MRYELKYAVDILKKESILASILMHPAAFSKAYDDRQVNNIYLDTPQFHCFHQNVEGHPRRQKMRLRWYGTEIQPTDKATLEIKQKYRELGWKDSFPIDATSITSKESMIIQLRQSGHLNSTLVPTLHNTYKRSYYISQDGYFRITVDTEQTFLLPFTNMKPLPMTQFANIVELKFDANKVQHSKFITDYLPFRQTKNSKYSNGVEYLYF